MTVQKKRSALDTGLDALSALHDLPVTPASVARLAKALLSGSNAIVARAAAVAADLALAELRDELSASFARFLLDPAKTDKCCLAKEAIADALVRLEVDDAALFLQGARHIQMEPVYGGQADTAANLRATCMGALARMGHSQAAFVILEGMLDKEPPARRGAVQAAAILGGREGELLLRFRGLAPDDDPSIQADAFAALMTSNPGGSFFFVAGFMKQDIDELTQGAALALAQSHLPEATELLLARYHDAFTPEQRRLLMLPLAITRSDEAFALLLKEAGEGRLNDALAALDALSIYAGDPERRKQIEEAIANRSEKAKLTQVLRGWEQ